MSDLLNRRISVRAYTKRRLFRFCGGCGKREVSCAHPCAEPHWPFLCSCLLDHVYIYMYPDTPRRGPAQGTGVRGVNREGQYVSLGQDFLRFPQRPRCPGCVPYPLQILGLGPVAFLACHMVSQLSLVRGGARSRVKSAPSPGLTRKEQADRRV